MLDRIDYRVATTWADVKAACRLVHARYMEAALLSTPRPSRLFAHAAHGHVRSDILVGMVGTRCVCTLSIFYWPELPCLDTWADVMEPMAANGTVAEAGQLATVPDLDFGDTLRLMCMAVQRCKAAGVQNTVCVCHPRHARFYTGMMHSSLASEEERTCPTVEGARAVLLRLDTGGCRVEDRRCCRVLQKRADFRQQDLTAVGMPPDVRQRLCEVAMESVQT